MKTRFYLYFSLLSLISYCPCNAQQGSYPFPDSRLAITEGVTIHYRHFPSHDTVVHGSVLLVHGFAGSTFSWRYITDTLQASGFEVVSVDVSPFGYSDKNPALNQSMTARGLLLLSFLRQVYPGRRWHLVGHSMGGGIVEVLALLAQDEVVSVTFVDGTVFSALSPGSYAPPVVIRSGFMRGVLLFTVKPFVVNRLVVRKLLASAYGRKPLKDEVPGYLKPLKVRGTSRAILKAASISEELIPLQADSLNRPVLAIWGEDDNWIPFHHFRQAIEQMPDVRFYIIPGAAHCPMETHPAAFIAILLPFLKGQG